ncbi:lectin C-type domain protein [Oesophagostomum dentatum]|uniref:Lectin C-type domain protein n=1 Tax=Oesophagostomum dentatum TaxID=61180 RepID=A0A0B1S3E8_OESDE|nr:lectin C-type domain protein [Oesophagostomum dentatum]
MILSGENFGKWLFYDEYAGVIRPFACQVPDCLSAVEKELVQLLDRTSYSDNDTSDYYLFGSVKSSLSFYDAEGECQRLGGHLPSISNAYENARVQNAAAKLFGTDNSIILGYYTPDDEFSWTDGNPSAYTNWAAGQPERDIPQPVAWMNLQSGFWDATYYGSMGFFMCALPAHRQSCDYLL